MIKNPFYAIYGLAMLAIMGFAQWSGFSLGRGSTSPRLILPRTIRENPGSYRPDFGSGSRFFGGK